MSKKNPAKNKKRSEPKKPNFSMSMETDSIYEPLMKVCKRFPKCKTFTSLTFTEDSISYETEWGNGEISWEDMNDALSLITGYIEPEEYFGLELAEDSYDDDDDADDE